MSAPRPDLRYRHERLAKALCIGIGAVVLVLACWVACLRPDFLKLLAPLSITAIGAVY